MPISSRSIRSIPFTVFSALCVIFLAGCGPHTWTPKPPYGSTTGGNDFDLDSKGSDPNGSPDIPLWAPQAHQSQNLPPTNGSDCKKEGIQPYQAGCTDQSKTLVQDTGTGITGLFCSLFGDPSSINGHANWTVARARGRIGWLNFADDGDYNLFLLPENEYGLTEHNNELPNNGGRYIEIEFDSNEFDGRFRTTWWQEFASLAQTGDTNAIAKHLYPSGGLAYGVVYGIFGIDCEHDCRSEIHPAYVVAIQVDKSRSSNTWAIFARNWGDEGFCSHLDHQLDLSSVGKAIRLVLPYKSPSGPTIDKKDYDAKVSSSDLSQCPTFNFLKDQGEEITIPLPAPGQNGLTEIFVDFQWPEGAAPIDYEQLNIQEVMGALNARKSEPKSAEENMRRLRELFNAERVRPKAKLSAAKRNVTTSTGCPVPDAASPGTKAATKVARATTKLPKLPTHPTKELWDRATLKDFCKDYKYYRDHKNPGTKLPEEPKLDIICSEKSLNP